MPTREHAPVKTLKDRLTLGPVEKYIIFGTFPWKMVLHILLVVFTTLQISALINTISMAHNRNQLRIFKKLFLDEEKEEFWKTFITPGQLSEHLTDVFEQLRALNENLYQDTDFTNTKFSIESYYTDYSQLNNDSHYALYYIEDIDEPIETPFNISDPDSVKEYSSTIYRMKINAENVETYMSQNRTQAPCVAWNISLTYDFSTLSDVDVSLEALPSYCSKIGWSDEGASESRNNGPVFHLAVLVLAIALIILNMRYFYKLGSIYITMKMNYQQLAKKRKSARNMLVDVLKSMNETDPDGIANRSADPEFYREIIEDSREWDELPYSMRFKLFEPWHYFSTFGALIQILGSLIILADQLRFSHTEYHKGQLGLVGMGTFFAWIQLLCYLSFNQNLTLITSILSKSLKTILVFYGIYIPIFISFGLLGHAFFWKYDEFESTGTALQKLFALAGGDIVHEIFSHVHDEGSFKQIYLFFYLVMFFTAFQNIFVAVIMDGYEMSKIRKQIDNDNPFPTPQSAQKAVRENRIKVNETAAKDDDDDFKSPGGVISSAASPYYWRSSPKSPGGISPEFLGISPATPRMDDFRLDSPATSLKQRGNQFNLAGLEEKEGGEEEMKGSGLRKPPRSIVTDFFSKELGNSDKKIQPLEEGRDSGEKLPSFDKRPSNDSMGGIFSTQTRDFLAEPTSAGLRQTDSPSLKPKLSKEEVALKNLRAMHRKIVENIRIMQQEASEFPENTVLGVEEQKYLKKMLWSKLTAITGKIDYITSLEKAK